MKQNLRLWIPLFTAAILIISGCSKNEETTVDPDVEPVEEAEPVVVEPVEEDNVIVEPVYENIYPLTGVGTNDEVNNRVIAVMINNHPKARPQTGLHKADIIYEALAEGFITRFVALYQSEVPENVGPIRSSRDYYIDLSKGYDALYVCHGYSPEAQIMMDVNHEIDFLNGIYRDGTLFKRANFRKAPHNSYITSENILKGADIKGYEVTQEVKPLLFLNTEEVENLEGQIAENLMITYSKSYNTTVSYNYDKEKEQFERYSNGVQTVDYETEIPIMLDNIFVVEVPHKTIDNVGRRELNLNAGGKGYLIQKGIINEIEWKNSNGRILPFKDGQEVGFVPGKTWINIIPTSPGLEEAVSLNPK